MNIRELKYYNERIGETNLNNSGLKMKIIDYKNACEILVQFEGSKYITKVKYEQFTDGRVKDLSQKTIYQIGYIGDGSYKGNINYKRSPQYATWKSMLQRCYDKKFHINHPTYKDCEVCEDWHNFQNFAKWYDENYYEIENEVMCLDKVL